LRFITQKSGLATGWLLVTIILLCMPGNNLPQPQGNWFEQLYMDKWIHVFTFGLLVWLFCRALAKANTRACLQLALAGCVYGIAMEFVQKWLISGRGFEGWDILADAAGCAIGCLLFLNRLQKKNHG
jgi:VanZ family protein